MRSRGALAALIMAVVLAAIGTVLWITGILRPAPAIVPAAIAATQRQRGVLTLTLDAGRTDPIDRIAETIRQTGRTIATGRFPPPMPATMIFTTSGATPRMRLVYDPGVLAAGAASGATADHMLDLAGQDSLVPDRHDPWLVPYCNRMETATRPFCENAMRPATGPSR